METKLHTKARRYYWTLKNCRVRERKESALQKTMPPNNMSITQLLLDTEIGGFTLYKWRKQAINKRQLVPGDGRNVERWSSANKFAAVLEIALINEAELALYCTLCTTNNRFEKLN